MKISMLPRYALIILTSAVLQACTPDEQEPVRLQEEGGSAAPDVSGETYPPDVPPPPDADLGAGAADSVAGP